MPGRIMKHDQFDLASKFNCVRVCLSESFRENAPRVVLGVILEVVLGVVLVVCCCRVLLTRACPLSCPVCEMDADAALVESLVIAVRCVTLGCWGLRVDLNELRRKGLEAEARARRDMKESGGGG